MFFAAADDVVMSGLFERSLALLRAFPDAGLCSSLSRLLDERGVDLGRFRSDRPLRSSGYIAPPQVSRWLLRNDGWFMGNTTIYRGAALRAVGFDLELGAFADGFACRAVALRHGACFIPEELAYWRRMTAGMASQSMITPMVVHAVIRRAVSLMKASFADDFPSAYPARWENRWLFSSISSAFDIPHEGRGRLIAELCKPLPKSTRLWFTFLDYVPWSCRIIAKLGAFLCLRPRDIGPVLLRKFIS